MDSLLNHAFHVAALVTLFCVYSVTGTDKVINYTQRLDHFGYQRNLSVTTFQQKIVIDDSKWAGAKAGAPIFAFLGEDNGLSFSPSTFSMLSMCASEFNAMLIQIEHRFYGDSIPLGSITLAMADHKVRACLSINQTLQDFAVIIQSLKKNLSAHHSPVIVVGMGYGGALAAWFRVKYPEITIGALASSTPIMYYGSSTPRPGYCEIVSKDFKDFDPICYESIRQSWKILDDSASQKGGLANLSKYFNTCRPLRSVEELKQPLAEMYSWIAQFEGVHNDQMKSTCGQLNVGNSTIQAIATLLQILSVGENCLDVPDLIDNVDSPFDPPSNYTTAWAWLRCSELIYPVGCERDTMLPARPFVMSQFKKSCEKRFGVVPHSYSHARFIYGNQSVEEYFIKNGGNIIFSNGLKDPFCSGTILKDLSKTITAITSTHGSHCWDMMDVQYDVDAPEWLIEDREKVKKELRQWINHSYQKNSKACNKPSAFTLLMIYGVLFTSSSFLQLL